MVKATLVEAVQPDVENTEATTLVVSSARATPPDDSDPGPMHGLGRYVNQILIVSSCMCRGRDSYICVCEREREREQHELERLCVYVRGHESTVLFLPIPTALQTAQPYNNLTHTVVGLVFPVNHIPHSLWNNDSYPTTVTCPFCGAHGETRLERHNTAYTCVAVVILAICFWPLFWLPFCITTLKKNVHFCSNCNRKVGTSPPCTS